MPTGELTPCDGEWPTGRLTSRMAQGDDSAWEEFHRRYFHRLLGYLRVLHGGDEDRARDSLQVTYLRIVKHVRGFEKEEVWWCWLTRVARSVAIDDSRKSSRYAALLERLALKLELQRDESRKPGLLETTLVECLAQLQPAERQLLESKYVEQWSYEELARKLDSTPRSIESRLARVRSSLKDCVMERMRHV
ncbi:MAG: sigma-70 family RNA polymerase sigma factor [Verrucomicrobiota bacterium]